MPVEVKKVLIPTFGGPEKVQVVRSTLADPALNEVQVQVLYSGFSGADINMRIGVYPLQRKAPLTPGYCFVGTVHALGAQSTKFAVGDMVACLSIYDAQATFTNQPEQHLVPLPRGLDPQIATTLVLDWNTAYGMVKGKGTEWKGKKVFIHGMSGAVGYALMMLCLLEGAQVYGTASARNHQAIRDLGATPFVYTDKHWMTVVKELGGAHGVFDALGFESWDESYSILANGGTLFGYGGNLGTLNNLESRSVIWPTLKLFARNLNLASCKSTTFYYISRDRASFKPQTEKVFELALQNKIKPSIKRVFELDDVATAHRDWTRLTGMGSVVVHIS
ncbi:uncharacterized protein A1O9_08069 [Exophiala aquamarina CBS 119918]|uniref:Enoyl reductase (ER) domain-containing protein n=1 Tax=Exophiala aquamarina CBS 119918 TaxID=1182545 RepID=A0A072PB26_9EURO|nr:uncharacterized protein A1O9_08069 [Exophiala aquamarina CBS 119918]KEF56488.1 hypothetical protein A1O9_08069 [Exophiala aquamarina CBS 119918]